MRVSRHSSLPQKKGEFAATATCTPAIAWAAFQYRAKASGSTCWWSCTLVQAASGAIVSAWVARRSTPADRDLEILAPRGEDLLVEQRVAGVGAEHLGPQMLGVDRRQDPDDHHVRADRAGPLLRVVETGPRVALELGEHGALQQPRLDVDLDVELPELGLEAWVGDRLERGGVDQGRLARVVRQVELDLQPERAALGVKARFREHPGEHVETGPDLTSVTLAILAAEGPGGDLLAHSHSIRESARGYNRGPSEFG